MPNWTDLKNNPRLNKILADRAEIIQLIREYFWQEKFTEIDTPIAVKLPGQEPYLNPVPAIFHDPRGREANIYLQTSPELSMKKLLAAGWSKIFQICKCFRDYEPFGGIHNTEFTMIEWYRAPGALTDIMTDTENLFKFIAKKINKSTINYKNKMINLIGPWDRLSMKEVWQKYAGINLDKNLDTAALVKLAAAKGYATIANESYENIFYKIFLNDIEPKLVNERPLIIYDYPALMCSLSRPSARAGYAERFELYIGGLELANAFGELTDSKEQHKLLKADRATRAKLGKPIWPVDTDFIAALNSGIPTASGIALGIDRMVLLFTEAKDINEVIFQSVSDQYHKNTKT